MSRPKIAAEWILRVGERAKSGNTNISNNKANNPKMRPGQWAVGIGCWTVGGGGGGSGGGGGGDVGSGGIF